jgi:hypothetical protein
MTLINLPLTAQAGPSVLRRHGVLPLLTLIGFGLNVLTLLLVLALALRSFANRQPTLVQLATGSTVAATAVDSSSRSEANLKAFTAEWLALSLNWSRLLPDGTVDRGMQAVGGLTLPTRVVLASQAMEPDLQAGWLKYLATDLKAGQSLQGSQQMVLRLRDISVSPEKTQQGYWKVRVIADWASYASGQMQGKAVPFNKIVFLKAVPIPPTQVAQSDLERAVYNARSRGLEVVGIDDIPPGE